jgi:long-chain acyl-CoA synthetase
MRAPGKVSTKTLAPEHSPAHTVAWLGRQVDLGVAEVDLSPAQYRTLIVLASGQAGSSSLAERLAVRPPSVTAMIDGLIARGLVLRETSAEDRRCVTHTLTDAGRQILGEADRAVERRLQNLSEYLNDCALEQQALQDLDLWRRALLERRLRKAGP